MVQYEIIEVTGHHIPKQIRDFVEAAEELDLCYTSNSLEAIYQSEEDSRMAIRRAMKICQNIGLPLEQHFRRRYIADDAHHKMKEAWRMSKVAYCLALMNGNLENPMVSRIQWEMVRRMI